MALTTLPYHDTKGADSTAETLVALPHHRQNHHDSGSIVATLTKPPKHWQHLRDKSDAKSVSIPCHHATMEDLAICVCHAIHSPLLTTHLCDSRNDVVDLLKVR